MPIMLLRRMCPPACRACWLRVVGVVQDASLQAKQVSQGPRGPRLYASAFPLLPLLRPFSKALLLFLCGFVCRFLIALSSMRTLYQRLRRHASVWRDFFPIRRMCPPICVDNLEKHRKLRTFPPSSPKRGDRGYASREKSFAGWFPLLYAGTPLFMRLCDTLPEMRTWG